MEFNITLGKELPLDDSVYKKIAGLYQLYSGTAEFYREDELLLMKLNGQLLEGLIYKGDNTFEGASGFNKATFELMANGEVATKITLWNYPENKSYLKTYEGTKFLKYSN